MRQVPEKKSQTAPSYAVLGSGRLAHHLGCYFQQLGLNFYKWSRSGHPAFNTISVDEISDPLARLAETVRLSDTILVAISDPAIVPLIEEIPNLENRTIVHFSGALSTSLAVSAHPLMTFGPNLYDLATYKRIPFVLEKNRKSFRELFPQLPNPSFAIDAEKKHLYHAYCVIGGNFTHFLWSEVFRHSEKDLGLKPEVFFPYLEQTARNLLERPDAPGTGPLVRGDMETIRCHLKALKDPALEGIYRAFLDLKKIQPE